MAKHSVQLSPRKSAKKHAARPKRVKYSAKTADRFELYQLAVQSPEADLEFLQQVFKRTRKRVPLHMREDFCGTALLCATWAGFSAKHTAEGFDLDHEPLAWGQAHNIEPLGDAAERVTLNQKDARAPGRRAPDIRIAQNFSYCILKERAELLDYFKRVRASLADDGMFAIDVYGGTEATDAMEETRKIEEGFTYVWDQARYLPGTGEYTCHIHFRFRDGTQMKKAFTYTWRFWSMPELKDLLLEAGFASVQSYFEQSDDDDGEGNGVYELDEDGSTCEDCAGWIAYLLAFK